MDIFTESLEAHVNAVKLLPALSGQVKKASDAIIRAFNNKNKVLLCGNGGSAADSQHIAAEFVSRFRLERRGLPAIALSTDTSILTAIGNDYSIDRIFSRQVEALAQPGDIVIGLSTSGKSPNVVEAIKKAREFGCFSIGFLGGNGGSLKDIVDIPLVVPSNDTPRIQECHILLGHIICDIVERAFKDQ
jgi:D-sedoheptulose 7-phosphate isomerase